MDRHNKRKERQFTKAGLMHVFSGTQLSLSEASTLALFCLHCGLIFEWLLSLPRLSLLTKTDPCHLLHIPTTVRSLKTKTFVTLDPPNGVLLSPEILLDHDQIFSFLLDSLTEKST